MYYEFPSMGISLSPRVFTNLQVTHYDDSSSPWTGCGHPSPRRLRPLTALVPTEYSSPFQSTCLATLSLRRSKRKKSSRVVMPVSNVSKNFPMGTPNGAWPRPVAPVGVYPPLSSITRCRALSPRTSQASWGGSVPLSMALRTKNDLLPFPSCPALPAPSRHLPHSRRRKGMTPNM